jgi:2-phosphosulfolactate phosphatase
MNNQTSFPVNLEWGLNGIKKYFDAVDIFIIVDVLSFSTCVDIAVNNGAGIIPYKFKDESAIYYAKSVNAECASFHRSKKEYSLSPCSLNNISSGTRLVLPSPNGSELSLSTGNKITLCGCLRNARAVGNYAASTGGNITVIAAGEKWSDRSLRPAIEDLIGAGAILCHIKNNLSPECETAIAVFEKFENNLFQTIKNSVSGQELNEKGFVEDIRFAAQLNVSNCVPVLKDGNIYLSDSNILS